ncbi:DoxD-like family protein [Pseudomonas sp. M47T1]|uniref:DoxX family protein n=1 Tax=Pseudomonas sp. M47T1 TaxID=1179778 RepID=UPI00026075A6|nr:DoxX family protein [Pseudomonas sp. M47T1]EIK96158.1 DoxD-like family protein [Pseudomonas sp. M47T1]
MNNPIVYPASIDGAYATDYRLLRPTRLPQWPAVIGIAATLIVTLYCSLVTHSLPDFAAWSSSLWLVVALASAVFITPRLFTVGFLVSLLPFLIAWRVAAMNGAMPVLWVASFTAVVLVLQFIDCAASDWQRHRGRPEAWLNTLLWQATIVRLCFGLNELCHSSEKIFAGLGSFHTLEHGFQGLGIAHGAALFVVLGGLIELASAISVGQGLFARLGALLSLVYFLVATLGFGGEWTRGYAWATPGGGGWEYVMLLLVVFGGVWVTGAGKFSIDGWLLRQAIVPGWLQVLCTNAEGRVSGRP